MAHSMLLILEDILNKKGFSSIKKQKVSLTHYTEFELNEKSFVKTEKINEMAKVFETKPEFHEVVKFVYVGDGWVTYFNDKSERGDIKIPFFSGLFSKNGQIYRTLKNEKETK